jgi:hypothetical protein
MSQSDVRPPRAKAQPQPTSPRPLKRVRDEVKEGVAVASASLVASIALVMFAAFVMKLAG